MTAPAAQPRSSRAAALMGGMPPSAVSIPAVRARQRPALVEAVLAPAFSPPDHNAPGATVAPMIPVDTLNALKAMAADAYALNIAKNAASRAAEKAEKALEAAMVAAGIGVGSPPILTSVTSGNETVAIEAVIEAKAGETISVEKLQAAVAADVFRKCIGATKGAVTTHAGTAVLNACTVPTMGKPGLKVRKR